jgi:FkbM family methyltransferase
LKNTDLSHRPIGRLLEGISPSMMDIGARGGADESMLDIAWASTMYAFEPEPAEAKRLAAAGDDRWKTFHVLPFAVGSLTGKSDLHIPETPAGASLLEHNPEMLDRFGYPQLHRTQQRVAVDTVTLDDLAAVGKIGRVDYMKLDIEGPELPVMQAGRNVLRDCVVVKTECSFLEQRLGQPRTWEVAEFLIDHGFEVVEIRDVHRWRRRNLPGHPYVINSKMPYSRGQIAQCDLVAIRSSRMCESLEQSLRLVILSAALGYFDYAVDALRNTAGLREHVSDNYRFDLEAELRHWSKAYGRRALRAAMKSHVRATVPLVRSMLRRLPFSRSADQSY